MGSGTNITQIWSQFVYEQWKMLAPEDRHHFLKMEKILNENRGQGEALDRLVPDSFILYVRDKFEEQSKILGLRFFWQSIVLLSEDKIKKAGRDAWLQYAIETLSTPIDLGHDIGGPNIAFRELSRLEGERNRHEDWTIENSILYQLSNLRRIFGLIARDLPVTLNLDWELAQIAPFLRELEFLVMSQPVFNLLVGLIIYESILQQRDTVPAAMRILNLPERSSESKFSTLFDLGVYWILLIEMREGEWHGRQFLDDSGQLINHDLKEFLFRSTGVSDFGDLRHWQEEGWAHEDVRGVRLFTHALQVYLNSRGGAPGSQTTSSDPSPTTPIPTGGSGVSATGIEVINAFEVVNDRADQDVASSAGSPNHRAAQMSAGRNVIVGAYRVYQSSTARTIINAFPLNHALPARQVVRPYK